MRDCSMRMQEIRRRISRYRYKQEKRAMVSLSSVCIALSCGIGTLLRMKQGPGIFTIQTEYGTVLTMLCIELNRRKISTSERRENG